MNVNLLLCPIYKLNYKRYAFIGKKHSMYRVLVLQRWWASAGGLERVPWGWGGNDCMSLYTCCPVQKAGSLFTSYKRELLYSSPAHMVIGFYPESLPFLPNPLDIFPHSWKSWYLAETIPFYSIIYPLLSNFYMLDPAHSWHAIHVHLMNKSLFWGGINKCDSSLSAIRITFCIYRLPWPPRPLTL